MKYLIFVFALSQAISLKGQDCCNMDLVNGVSITEIGKEFQRLRKEKNSECCKNFGSGLMQVMDMLQDSLNLGVSENSILGLLGSPDNYATKEHPINHHFMDLDGNERVLIYYWRGMHDFIYFILKDDRLILKNWYYSLD